MNACAQRPVGRAAPRDETREGCLLLLCRVPAGFASQFEAYEDRKVDLHRFLVRNELSTFTMFASGDSMTGAGILDGDLLVVDRSIEPYSGAIVIAVVDGEMMVKRYVARGTRHFLQPENGKYAALEVTGREDVFIWGVVTSATHRFTRRGPVGSR